jgi:hypothetical protein
MMRFCYSGFSRLPARVSASHRMSAADRLIGNAQDYEVLAASHSEREALAAGNRRSGLTGWARDRSD